METRLTTVGPYRFLTNPNDIFVGKSLELYGEWSYGEVEAVARLAKPDANIVEVGANIGAHTVFLARDICPQGIVYAFEPRRLLFQLLCANVTLNGLENVRAFQLAAGATRRQLAEGALPTDAPANMGAYAIGDLPGDGERVAVAPLDDMIEQLKPVALIKADVEGHELEVLQGAGKLIARDRPLLYVENDRIDRSPPLIEHIIGLGYDLWWHIVPLFRQNNHARSRANIFGNIASFNMIGIPAERQARVEGLAKVEIGQEHPLQQAKRAPAAPA